MIAPLFYALEIFKVYVGLLASYIVIKGCSLLFRPFGWMINRCFGRRIKNTPPTSISPIQFSPFIRLRLLLLILIALFYFITRYVDVVFDTFVATLDDNNGSENVDATIQKILNFHNIGCEPNLIHSNMFSEYLVTIVVVKCILMVFDVADLAILAHSGLHNPSTKLVASSIGTELCLFASSIYVYMTKLFPQEQSFHGALVSAGGDGSVFPWEMSKLLANFKELQMIHTITFLFAGMLLLVVMVRNAAVLQIQLHQQERINRNYILTMRQQAIVKRREDEIKRNALEELHKEVFCIVEKVKVMLEKESQTTETASETITTGSEASNDQISEISTPIIGNEDSDPTLEEKEINQMDNSEQYSAVLDSIEEDIDDEENNGAIPSTFPLGTMQQNEVPKVKKESEKEDESWVVPMALAVGATFLFTQTRKMIR